MLMVLFAIRMVASNFLGFESSCTTKPPLLVFSSEMELRSVCESPNKATSAPEISAEHSRSKKRTPHFMANIPSKTANMIALWGSGSN